jgi:hypothetical protein
MSVTPYVLYSASVRVPAGHLTYISVLNFWVCRPGVFFPPTNVTRDVGEGLLIYQRTLAGIHI